MSTRLDLADLRPPRRTADGRLIADAHITRVGVFLYRNPDGTTRRELRDDADVFDPASVASASHLPITVGHSATVVTPANARAHMVGSTGEQVHRDGDHLRTSVVVHADAGIRALEGGVTQVSCGYRCDVDKLPGVHPKYGAYDCRQRNIRYNHLAIVSVARAGDSARIRMDDVGPWPDGPTAMPSLPHARAGIPRLSAYAPRVVAARDAWRQPLPHARVR